MKGYRRKFTKYVSLNILGMIGMSVYILADTIFISMSEGSDGITALNLVLPVYSLIFAIGAMIGVGSAIRYKILKARNESVCDRYLFNALFWTFAVSMIFVLIGIFFPGEMIGLLGGDEQIIKTGIPYTRTFMVFAPFFMWNYVIGAFVRNDNDPALAMCATILSSLFNIIMDYVFMFPMNMGMTGAALATGLSPVVGIIICSIHFLSGKNTLKLRLAVPSVRKLAESAKLGVAAFVSEITSGVTTTVFNILILRIAGNVGVAAYAVVANTALVAISMFNGVMQGSQPLISECYGSGDVKNQKKMLKYGVCVSVAIALLLLFAVNMWAPQITAAFNAENSEQLAVLAEHGIKIYFIGFLFAGINIIITGYLSATASPLGASVISISRGIVMITVCAFVLSYLFGLDGVWCAFPLSELITIIMAVVFLCHDRSTER